MPRTVIIPKNIVGQESITLEFADADAQNGMMFVNDGTTLLLVRNESLVNIQVTIVSVPDEAGRVGNWVKTIEPGDTEVFGQYLPEWWNQRTENSGYIYVDFDADTDVKVCVINYY